MEAFELRLWDGRIGRWLSPDPYGQFHSPYIGMGNNPISRIDPDGGTDGESDLIELNEVIVTAPAPTYRIPNDVASLYPNFTDFVNFKLPKLLNDPFFANVMSEFTGYTVDFLRNKVFKAGEGPEIVIGNVGIGDGTWRVDGKNQTIIVDEKWIKEFETGDMNTNSLNGLVNLMSAAILVSHETSHIGIHMTGKKFITQSINDEPGDALERTLLGVDYKELGTTSDRDLRNYVYRNFKNLQSIFK